MTRANDLIAKIQKMKDGKKIVLRNSLQRSVI